MRIPLPRVPERWSALLDAYNEPMIWRIRWIDPIIFAFYLLVIAIDGTYFQGWERALVLDPPLIALGWMTSRWFL